MNTDNGSVRCVTLTSGIVLIGNVREGSKHTIVKAALRLSYDQVTNKVGLQSLTPYAASISVTSVALEINQVLVHPYVPRPDLEQRYLEVIAHIEAARHQEPPQAVVSEVTFDDDLIFVKR